ncbi:uncharacterized protein C1orf115-like [Acanthochromis polyacanthus]|uniref:uncharacterized protein C1orf115-like n=1 Tax=Acanthochromis polyacanthus TaxID=80966 RepID=UPI002234CEED|nr:uncharacterized protein C1orf115-like [Acanthochromis polyacanthus]
MDADKKQQKSSREVYFSVLPDKYEPLEEDDEEDEERKRRKEEKKERRKKKHKKYRKNVRKALGFSWRCFVVGLQVMGTSFNAWSMAVVIPATTEERWPRREI